MSTINQISSVNLTAPTVGAVTHFYQSVSEALALADPEKLGIKPLADPFTAHVEQLALVQNKQRANSAGTDVTNADRRRDAIVSFLFRLFTLMKDSPTQAEAEAGARLELLAKSYPNLAYTEMSRETVLIDGLLRDLAADSRAADVLTLNLDTYIEALDSAQSDFKTADAARKAEELERAKVAGGQTSAELRRTCATEYKTLVQMVNALALVQPTEEKTAFIDQVNAAIIHLEQVIATEKAANTRQANAKKA